MRVIFFVMVEPRNSVFSIDLCSWKRNTLFKVVSTVRVTQINLSGENMK